MATPLQNVFSADRSNFSNFQNAMQGQVGNAQQWAPELSAMFPNRQQFAKAMVDRMLQGAGAEKYINPHYADFLTSQAGNMSDLQLMEAVGNYGMVPRAQDFPQFIANWLGPTGGSMSSPNSAYGFGGAILADPNTFNKFTGAYTNALKNDQYSNPSLWGFLSGLSNSDLYGLNRLAYSGFYGEPATQAMDRYLQNAYQTFDQSSLPWWQFLQQIQGPNGLTNG